jgi:hypothetical protein
VRDVAGVGHRVDAELVDEQLDEVEGLRVEVQVADVQDPDGAVLEVEGPQVLRRAVQVDHVADHVGQLRLVLAEAVDDALHVAHRGGRDRQQPRVAGFGHRLGVEGDPDGAAGGAEQQPADRRTQRQRSQSGRHDEAAKRTANDGGHQAADGHQRESASGVPGDVAFQGGQHRRVPGDPFRLRPPELVNPQFEADGSVVGVELDRAQRRQPHGRRSGQGRTGGHGRVERTDPRGRVSGHGEHQKCADEGAGDQPTPPQRAAPLHPGDTHGGHRPLRLDAR